jgi:hypothetical protein
MIADRAYWPSLHEPPSGRTSLLYFAAAVPAVGFVHGFADLDPRNSAALDAKQRPVLSTTRPMAIVPQSSRRWPLGLRWLALACGT